MSKKSYRILPYGVNLFKIPAVIGGNRKGDFQKVNLLIDTGASFTIISPMIIIDLDYNPTNYRQTQRITTGKGTTAPIPMIDLNWFNCGGKIVNNFPILAYDIPSTLKVDGVLGMDFLVKYGAIISLQEQKMYFV
ncbi:MAG: aspartyl protease family protein [Cyanobacterium sp.]